MFVELGSTYKNSNYKSTIKNFKKLCLLYAWYSDNQFLNILSYLILKKLCEKDVITL